MNDQLDLFGDDERRRFWKKLEAPPGDYRVRSARCPCCERMAHLYHRAINSEAAAWLIRLYRLDEITGKPWHHVREITPGSKDKAGSDGAYLVEWGFILPKLKPAGKDAKDSGEWRILDAGKEFVRRRSTVPLRLKHIGGGKRYGVVGEEVDILFCLRNQFSYWELMRWSPPGSGAGG